ncbi:MAG: class I SAM-dependent methyltransferase [Candidatus Woesearchaeota archaeon]|jgi:SAM-dependent methyltransferase|nr:class I SAM-dependent methyltransferase [Candidatus Woesearchaeota archaeon]MDP6265325.1 class I SAM-dependent methyltransferase [Candidatus Woesearchaeota archaeon]MDP7323004.1 class I SAM-dependent methyltransferase [Candidatus Woesearchaeota archaeon]MDP7476472.1 class I SAM-dependent methyltransferase [Candidatus Woesearchaeota archaeon]HJO01305.1 class I SAM-dependent methyltransferase [Candidatus Woesearchaeota archaeon]|tara:strand:+ start:985 stop:1593 length:609 start_codon:yes stop_codon:yes gene_type:complete
MTKRAYIFRNPWLYSLSIRLLHFDGFKKIKDIIGKEKNVFEPACGFGRLQRYLYDSCSYSGIDLNEIFINFGKKRGLDIRIGNVLEETNYIKSDIIILCDILHHLTKDKIQEVVSIATKFAKEKIVIMEPTFVGLASGKGFFSRLAAKVFARVDFDGINNIEHWFTRQDYQKLFKHLKETNKFAGMKIQISKGYYFVELIRV